MKKDEEKIINQNTTQAEKENDEEEIVQKEAVQNKEDVDTKNESDKQEVISKAENNKEDSKKEEKKDNTKKIKSKHEKKSENPCNKIITLIIILIISSFILFLLSTIFAILNLNNSNIITGVYVENINISNLTKEEAARRINEKISVIEDVELKFGEYNTIVKLEDMGIEILAKEAINNAINLGKTNNILIDNYSILKANIFKTKFKLDITINEEKLEDIIKNIQAEIPEGIKEYSYDIKDDELIITSGKSGQKIIKEQLKKEIIYNIKEQFNGSVLVINIPTKYQEAETINIEEIYSETYKEPKDAYIVEEPFELHKEENGVDFRISIEEAKQIVKEQKETYVIPLKITKPKIKISDLGEKLFKQTLAKYTTIYDSGNKNRSHNIALAAQTINGTILLPGETFSYNKILGNTNKEKGYKLGTAYVGGKVVESYGGGICQVSSTLYNSVLYANLEIVERYNHSYVVSYVPAGRDATVAYGGKDFKFKNSRNYPVKIVASAKNGVVSVSIMGIKEEVEYEVVLSSTVLSTTPRSVLYENNSTMEEGTQKVIQKGYDGKKSIAYKTIKYNGKTISKTVLSKDTYKPMSQIIQVGTKKVTSTPTSTTPQQSTNTEVIPNNEVTSELINNTNI